jgi:homoserine kinase
VASAAETGEQLLAVGRSVTVEVPATSANLGPGFDCFGLALDWVESVKLEVLESGYRIDVSGEGAEQLPRNESHLILRSALVGLADLGYRAPGLGLTCHNTIPHGRGLGSSSAAIVAGLAAAQGLTGQALDPAWLIGHADAIEGHPDNVAAAVLGGFTLAYDGPRGVTAVRAAVAPRLGVLIFVPDNPVATSAARGLLPAEVPHGDAAANAGRSALLVHALGGDLDRLAEATRDWLHQDYRQSAMPQSYELMQELRGRGFAAVISGAGPTVLVLGADEDLRPLAQQGHPGFRARTLGVGPGTRLVCDDAPATHPNEK